MFMANLVLRKQVVFLSLSSETRKDLYDSKQYHFCPHGLLQSKQNDSYLEGLKKKKMN